MAIYTRLLFVLSFIIILLASCTKPVLVGSDFLDDEKADLLYKDDFTLTTYTEKTDSVLVYGPLVSQQLVTYLCGELNDPIFGKTIAEIYAQPFLTSIATELFGATLDSVIVELRYDTIGSYGALNEAITMEVYRMIENPDFNQEVYSNQRFMVNPEVLGSRTFFPEPKDSVTVYTPDDTLLIAPHVRIPLNTALLSDLTTQDSIVYTNQDSFLNFFSGLNIKMSDANGTTNTMLGFNLVNSVSGMHIYFKNANGTDEDIKLIFMPGSVKTVYMEHDYAGTLVGSSLSPEPENDYWFIQGLSGVTSKMQVDGLSDLGTAIINEAELEIYCTFPDGDEPELFPPCQYILTQYKDVDTLKNSLDVIIALFRESGNYHTPAYELLYGGVLNKVEDGPPAVYKYTMKVTSQVKDIFKGKQENIIYFNPIDKSNMPCRTVMIGPGDPLYAPRLKVYYTAL